LLSSIAWLLSNPIDITALNGSVKKGLSKKSTGIILKVKKWLGSVQSTGNYGGNSQKWQVSP
jgi:hypothetical protein